MNDAAIVALICLSREFDNIRVRDEELSELDILKRHCVLDVCGDLVSALGCCDAVDTAVVGVVACCRR